MSMRMYEAPGVGSSPPSTKAPVRRRRLPLRTAADGGRSRVRARCDRHGEDFLRRRRRRGAFASHSPGAGGSRAVSSSKPQKDRHRRRDPRGRGRHGDGCVAGAEGQAAGQDGGGHVRHRRRHAGQVGDDGDHGHRCARGLVGDQPAGQGRRRGFCDSDRHDRHDEREGYDAAAPSLSARGRRLSVGWRTPVSARGRWTAGPMA